MGPTWYLLTWLGCTLAEPHNKLQHVARRTPWPCCEGPCHWDGLSSDPLHCLWGALGSNKSVGSHGVAYDVM